MKLLSDLNLVEDEIRTKLPPFTYMSNVYWLCASFGFALFADWATQKWKRVSLWLGIVAVLLYLEREMLIEGWLLLGIILLCLLMESLRFRRWCNWASKEILQSLGISSCARLSVIAVQALIFRDLMADLPPGTGSWGFVATGASLWLQVLVLVVLTDFKRYWFHRLDHLFSNRKAFLPSTIALLLSPPLNKLAPIFALPSLQIEQNKMIHIASKYNSYRFLILKINNILEQDHRSISAPITIFLTSGS